VVTTYTEDGHKQNTKQALQYRPKERRNIGRPRKRWRDQLHPRVKEQETCLTLHEHDDDDDSENNSCSMKEATEGTIQQTMALSPI
jgi:hypothetical protein